MSSMMPETAAMMPETADGTVPAPGTGSPVKESDVMNGPWC